MVAILRTLKNSKSTGKGKSRQGIDSGKRNSYLYEEDSFEER